VNDNWSKKSWCGRSAHIIIRGGLLAGAVVATCGIVCAQDVTQDKKDEVTFSLLPNPATPAAITPPAGNSRFLAGHALGAQGYICLPTGSGASWTVNNARPEATLFTNIGKAVQIVTHFLSPDTNPNKFAPSPLPFGSPTWQSSFDSSKVWGQPLDAIPAGSGGKTMTKTTYIQRLNTNAGSAPASGCSVPADVGKQTLVPYSADYYFFRADQ